MNLRVPGVLLLALLLLLPTTGCDNPRRTTEELRKEIEAYSTDPTQARKAEIETLFAKLDEEIARLDKRAATRTGEAREATAAELAELKQTRRELQAEFQGAQLRQAVDQAKEALKGVGDSISDSLRQAGEELRDALDGTSPTPSPTGGSGP